MFRQNFLKLPTLLLLEGRLSGGLKPVLEAKRKKKILPEECILRDTERQVLGSR